MKTIKLVKLLSTTPAFETEKSWEYYLWPF